MINVGLEHADQLAFVLGDVPGEQGKERDKQIILAGSWIGPAHCTSMSNTNEARMVGWATLHPGHPGTVDCCSSWPDE